MIRPFGIQDARLLSQLQNRGTYLDLRRALLLPHDSVSAALLAYLPLGRSPVRTLVMRESINGTGVAGYIQYRERRERHEADIIFCAPALERNGGAVQGRTIWQKLVTHLVVRLGERGFQRVYARILDGAPELDLFWQLGFSAYARERIYRRQGLPGYARSVERTLWRPQRPRDSWNVGQLYSAVTPRLVQQAENLPHNNSAVPYRDRLEGGLDRRFVWGQGDEVGGALRLIQGNKSCWLKLMLNPQWLDLADALVQDAMRLVPPQVQQLYVSVREYQSELEGAILRAGLSWLATEMLMVKHTTVMVKKPVLKPLPVIEGIEARPTASTTHSMK